MGVVEEVRELRAVGPSLLYQLSKPLLYQVLIVSMTVGEI